MSAIDNLLMNVFLPLNDPHAGLEVGRLYAELHRSEWHDLAALERLQQTKLRGLLGRARASVPFYRDYDPWQNVAKGTLLDRLATYPILTKEAIRACPAKMHVITGLPRSCARATTGGTTGEPIEIWYSPSRRAIVDAATWRGKSWAGIRPWTRGVNVQSVGRGSWYGRLRMRLTNKRVLDLSGQSAVERARSAAKLARFRPAYLEGYVSDTVALGEACFKAGVKIACVLTCGEKLYDHQRREIERLYGAKVLDYYGCNEVGAMAFECEMGRKHVTDEHVIVEVVDETGQPVWEKPGRILLTDLDNALTPLVRYDVGDVGALTRELCPCGRRLTVLKELEGRTQDAIRNATGARLSTVFLAGRFRDLKAIHRIQLIQRTLTAIDLLHEGSSPGVEEELRAVVGEIRDRLGPQMAVTPRRVDQLFHTRVGKRRLIISLDEAAALPQVGVLDGRAHHAG
jgi:phenylacetate-CoA ligase